MTVNWMKRIITTTIFVAYLGVMAYGALSRDIISQVPTGYDKILHFAQFFVLVIITYAMIKSYIQKDWLATTITAAVSSLLALATEYVQRLVPYRSSSSADLLADFIGIGLSLTLIWVIIWTFYKR